MPIMEVASPLVDPPHSSQVLLVAERVEEGEIRVVHCPTAQMPADLLTKPLGRLKVENCLKLLGLVSFGGSS